MFFSFCDMYHKLLKFLIVLAGLLLMFAVGLQVLGRYVPFIPTLLWTLELTNFSLIWSVFIGASIGVRDGQHFFVDVFQYDGQAINPKLDIFLRVLCQMIMVGITFVFIYYGWQYVLRWGMVQNSDITGINLGWLYASVPFAGMSFLLFLVEGMLKKFMPPKSGERS